MAEMTPDYEIEDDVMYASDQRSVGIPAKVLALTAPKAGPRGGREHQIIIF